ncbi:MAG: DNA alkylation repair protein, partial [Cyanobacteria bacterium P01_H01_bin.15]
ALPALELKERISCITNLLYQYLPSSYKAAVTIILRSLPPELDPHKTDDDFGDFIFAPFSMFVATYGCIDKYLDFSLAALKEITKRFSAEDAIRYFLNAYPQQTLAFLYDCAQDSNYHVRRLASEGTRPKLPWSQKLQIDHHDPEAILDLLFADKTRYVTRSVANHLNDISKIDPPFVMNRLQAWNESQQQTKSEMQFITRHALRTLVKKGNSQALYLLGFGEKPDITVLKFTTDTPQVRIGEALIFSLTLRSHKHQKLLIDYVMQFASEGTKRSQKVYKIKPITLQPDEEITLQKRHPLRPMSTRRLTPGEHQITLQINGEAHGSLEFDLLSA